MWGTTLGGSIGLPQAARTCLLNASACTHDAQCSPVRRLLHLLASAAKHACRCAQRSSAPALQLRCCGHHTGVGLALQQAPNTVQSAGRSNTRHACMGMRVPQVDHGQQAAFMDMDSLHPGIRCSGCKPCLIHHPWPANSSLFSWTGPRNDDSRQPRAKG